MMPRLLLCSATIFCAAGFGLKTQAGAAAGAPASEPLRIAAASDLRFALEKFKDLSEVRNLKIQIEIVYGSSGQFFRQIESGAPFDLFLSADESFPRQLADRGFAYQLPIDSSLPRGRAPSPVTFQYGTGHLVVWSRRDSHLRWTPELGLKSLQDRSVDRISIANPRHAPYGELANGALKQAMLLDSLQDRLVTADGVAQAAQMAVSGAAAVGLISESLAKSTELEKIGHYFLVDSRLAPPLKATGMIVKTTTHPNACRDFRDLLLSARGQKLLAEFGLAKVP